MALKSLITVLLISLALSSCSEYGKILRSKNIDVKYEAAIKYYEEGDCYKAIPILDELIGLVRGTDKYESVYYYYAKANYCIGDYYLANYYSKNFSRTFSTSTRAEELLFLSAMSSYQNSPKSSLDQSSTDAAINEFQFFLDNYPNSQLKDSCENMMLRLNKKLERKAYDIAELYVKTGKYKSATLALESVLEKYPDSQYRENLYFLKVESWYEYANGSVYRKKEERFRQCIKNYYTLLNIYPQSEYSEEAEGLFTKAYSGIKKSTEAKFKTELDSARAVLEKESVSITELEENVFIIQEIYRPLEKELLDLVDIHLAGGNYKSAIRFLEYINSSFEHPNYPLKSNYLLAKSYFDLAETGESDEKADRYRECIRLNGIFADQFPQSTYLEELEDYASKSSLKLASMESE